MKRVIWPCLLFLLVISSPFGNAILDRDGLGVSDIWEAEVNNGLPLAASGNEDGDRYSNEEEYRWGFDPNTYDQRATWIEIGADSEYPDQLRAYIHAFRGLGRTPRYEYRDDLTGGNWVDLGTVTGDGTFKAMSEIINQTTKFFRVIPVIVDDQDGDGLDGWEEFTLGTHPGLADSDHDFIDDVQEYLFHSDPTVSGVHGGLWAGESGQVSGLFTNTSGSARDYTILLSGSTIEIEDQYLVTRLSQVWEDIAGSGTRLNVVSSQNDAFEEVSLGQDILFYGVKYDSLFVSSNGFITLGVGSAQSNNAGPLPSSGSPANLIAPMFDDLDPSDSGDIYFQDFGTHVIVQWTEVRRVGGAKHSFQVRISQGGDIEFRYGIGLQHSLSSTIGIQNADRTMGIGLSHDEAFVERGMVMQFDYLSPPYAQWFSVQPTTFTLNPGQSQTLDIQVQAFGPYHGYRGTSGSVAVIENASGETVHEIDFSLGTVVNDVDGDWMDDSYESLAGLDPLVEDGIGDLDGDHLNNRIEFNLNLDPDDFDSDDDLLSDGFEYLNGLDPLDPTGDNGKDGDPDLDNLTNFFEQIHGTHPKNDDEDLDGTPDGIEVTQGSDPNSSADGGLAQPPGILQMVSFAIGDPSGSHSERWEMTVASLDPEADSRSPFRPSSEVFGQVDTIDLNLRKNGRYEITLNHLDSENEEPDYDWEAQLDSLPTTPVLDPTQGGASGNVFILANTWIVLNTSGLLGQVDDSFDSTDQTAGLTATIEPITIRGHQPGPGGAVVPYADKRNPDNLFLPQNDDVDLNLRDSKGLSLPDNDSSKTSFNTGLDADYIRVTLMAPDELDVGTLKLQAELPNGSPSAATPFFNFWTADGQTKLDSGDLTLNLENPTGALAPIASHGSIDLLVEARGFGGTSDIRLVWTYELNSTSIEEKLHLHILDVDFKQASPNSGFDDNNDQLPGPDLQNPELAYPALIVPLPSEGGTSNNQVKVLVEPDQFYERVGLASNDTGIASIPSSISSGNQIINITGTTHNKTQVAANFKDDQGNILFEAARMYVDVKNRLQENASELKSYSVFRVKQQGEASYPGSHPGIEEFLNTTTWGKQSNVFFDETHLTQFLEVDYESVGDQQQGGGAVPGVKIVDGISLSSHPEASLIRQEIDQHLADIGSQATEIIIVYVDQLHGPDNPAGYAFSSGQTTYCFIDSNAGIDVVAHEVGHGIGLNNVAGEGHSVDFGSNDLMREDAGSPGIQDHLRRYDWNVVNP